MVMTNKMYEISTSKVSAVILIYSLTSVKAWSELSLHHSPREQTQRNFS